MASGATTTISVVKAGYWFCGSKYLIRSVQDMPSELFTHLYAGFAEVNIIDGKVIVPEQYSDQFETFTHNVRERSPTVKTLLSIGGEGSHISSVAVDELRRKKFIRSSIILARNFHFDGLDLCWLYPSNADQMTQLALLIREWRDAINEEVVSKPDTPKLLLTAAVFHHPAIPGPDQISVPYDPDISKYLDWINVLAIDFYTPSNSPGETGPVHAWRTRYTEPTRCGSHGVKNWITNIEAAKVTSQKLVLGLPFYGYKWILDNPNICESIFALAHPATETNPISYRNIPPNPRKHNEYYVASYVQNEGSWFGFDDGCDVSTKVSEAIGKTYKLGGYFAWNLGGDDDKWTLSRAASSAANAVNP